MGVSVMPAVSLDVAYRLIEVVPYYGRHKHLYDMSLSLDWAVTKSISLIGGVLKKMGNISGVIFYKAIVRDGVAVFL